MRCPRCNSEHTSLSWLREYTIVYWCMPCHAGFEVDRTLVQSTARPIEGRSEQSGTPAGTPATTTANGGEA